MKNIVFIAMLLLGTITLSGCYDELDKTEAFEPFTRLTFTPEDGDFTGATEITVEVLAPNLQMAAVTATNGSDVVDLGELSFTNGAATLTVPVAILNGANRINFTAENTDGRPFTTRYSITY